MNTEPTRQVTCARCTTFALPQMGTDVRNRVTELVRQEQRAMATKVLHDKTGLDLRDCKGVILHITHKKGICHRCKKPLSGQDEVICSNCKSLNLDW